MATDYFDKEIFLLATTTPENIQSPSSVTFLPDNRLIVCCSDVIILFVICADQNFEFARTSDSGPRASPLVVNNRRIVYRNQFPAFFVSDGVLDFVSSFKNVSREDRHFLPTDPLLCKDTYFPRADLGGFRSVRSTPLCPDNGLLLGVVTLDHTSFILEEKEDKWSILVSLNQLVKDLVMFDKKLPMELEKDLSLVEYKDLIYSMAYCELAWSSIYDLSSETSENECKKFILLFSGMKNGDVHIWQIALPLKTVEDFTYLKTEKCFSEVSALFYYPFSSQEGYLCVGLMNGNIKLLNIQIRETVNISQDFADDHNDALLIQAFACSNLTSSHILVAAKQYFLLFYIIRHDKTEHFETIHTDCSLPIGSLSMRGETLCVSSEDGSVFEYFVNVKHDRNILIELSQRKSLNLSTAKSFGFACKGLSLSSNGMIVVSVYQPNNDYIYSKQKSKSVDMQYIVLSIPKIFTVNSVVENIYHCETMHNNFQDVIVSVCLYFQYKIKNNQLNSNDKIIIQSLIDSERAELLHIARALVCNLKFKGNAGIRELQYLGIGDSFDHEKLDQRILGKYALKSLQYASKDDMEEGELEFLSSMSLWFKHFGLSCSEVQDGADVCQKYSISKTTKCFLCHKEIITFDDLLSVICVEGHKTKLSCLTFSPIHGLNIRKCFSCGAVAENVKSLPPISFIRDEKRCTRCGGHFIY